MSPDQVDDLHLEVVNPLFDFLEDDSFCPPEAGRKSVGRHTFPEYVLQVNLLHLIELVSPLSEQWEPSQLLKLTLNHVNPVDKLLLVIRQVIDVFMGLKEEILPLVQLLPELTSSVAHELPIEPKQFPESSCFELSNDVDSVIALLDRWFVPAR